MKNGDMVIAGQTSTGYFQLGDVELIYKTAAQGMDYSNLFVYRITPDGDTVWTRQFQNMHEYYGGEKKGAQSDEFSQEIDWDAISWNDEVLYLTGIFQSDSFEVAGEALDKEYPYGIFVATLDLDEGKELWGYALSSDYNTGLRGFDVDAGGNVTVMGRTGEFQDYDVIGPVTVPGNSRLIFHLGLDYNGAPIWYNNAHLMYSGSGLSGRDLEVLPDGEVFTCLINSQMEDAVVVGGSDLQSQYPYDVWMVPLVVDNEVGGMVTEQSGSPIYAGWVKAYKSTRSGAYPAVDSTVLDEGGNYLFEGLYPGNYTLLAVPHPLEYPDGMPTYYGDAIGWNEASFFDVKTDTKAGGLLNIKASELAKLTPEDGSGGVTGNISYEEVSNLKGTLARPVTRTSVILKKKSSAQKSTLEEDVVAYVSTDPYGNFYFTNVPDGEYILVVDIPGLEMLEEHHVTIQGDQLVSGLDYTVSDEGIYTYGAVAISVEEKVPFVLYPNPGNGLIRIGLPAEGDYQVRVFSPAGQLVSSRNYTSVSGITTLDISELNAGLYMIQVEGDEASGVVKYMKE